jgi:hypothetical protein
MPYGRSRSRLWAGSVPGFGFGHSSRPCAALPESARRCRRCAAGRRTPPALPSAASSGCAPPPPPPPPPGHPPAPVSRDTHTYPSCFLKLCGAPVKGVQKARGWRAGATRTGTGSSTSSRRAVMRTAPRPQRLCGSGQRCLKARRSPPVRQPLRLRVLARPRRGGRAEGGGRGAGDGRAGAAALRTPTPPARL